MWLSLLGISWFWFYGATILAQFPSYAKEVLHGDEGVFILLLTVFSFGIGLGSLLCEKLSAGQVEIGLVPFGAIGLTVFGVDLYWFSSGLGAVGEIQDFLGFLHHPAHWRGLIDIMLIGMFGGFYIVPLYALIQTRSEKSHQSRVIAANNILNALFMVASAGVSMALFAAGLSIPQLFLATAIFNAVVAIYIYRLVPEFLIRFIVWILVHSVYRLEKKNVERIPETGAALIVCNHASFADVLVITAACRRPVRFVINQKYFSKPVLGAVLKAGRAIPLVLEGHAAQGIPTHTLEEIKAALTAGEAVALFPEGDISTDGTLRPFHPWISQLFDSQFPVSIVPLALSGLWESAFSGGQLTLVQRLLKLRLFREISIAAGNPIAAAMASPDALQQEVLLLRGQGK